MADAMAVLVGKHGLAEARKAQSVTQQCQLAVVQPLHPLQPLQRPN